MWPISRLVAAGWLCCTRVDTKFEAEDRMESSGFVKGIPMSFDDGNEAVHDVRGGSGANVEVVVEFIMEMIIPLDNVCT